MNVIAYDPYASAEKAAAMGEWRAMQDGLVDVWHCRTLLLHCAMQRQHTWPSSQRIFSAHSPPHPYPIPHISIFVVLSRYPYGHL